MIFKRPENEGELQKREAIGVIRASRFVRKYAQSHKLIDIKVIFEIHKEIFQEAWPEIAGKYRKENLSITDSELLLPHHQEVEYLMEQLDKELKSRLLDLEVCEGKVNMIGFKEVEMNDEAISCISKIISISSWIHHSITAIHPFLEGNGRTARLVGNLILERYGLVGISVKIEKENKNEYRKALAQIDKYKDYEPLENIISEGIIDRYNGVSLKYYKN